MSMIILKVVRGISIILILLIIPTVKGETITIDATDMNSWGENQEAVLIGELSYRERIEVEITNLDDNYNIITFDVVEASLIWEGEIEGYTYIPSDNATAPRIHPGNKVLINYSSTYMEKINIGFLVTSYFNESATNSQQEEVEVEYHYQIFDDTGKIIKESKKEINDNDPGTGDSDDDTPVNGDENEETSEDPPIGGLICCGLIIMIIVGIIAYVVYASNKRKKT